MPHRRGSRQRLGRLESAPSAANASALICTPNETDVPLVALDLFLQLLSVAFRTSFGERQGEEDEQVEDEPKRPHVVRAVRRRVVAGRGRAQKSFGRRVGESPGTAGWW